MDIDKALTHFMDKDDLMQMIRELPGDAVGVIIFRHSGEFVDDEGDPIDTLSYKVYGGLSPAESVFLSMEAIDMARNVNP